MEETFDYRKVADWALLKPHSLRAYCSVKKIKSTEMPKKAVLEYLEGRISRLEKESEKNPAKKPTLNFVRNKYIRLGGEIKHKYKEIIEKREIHSIQEPQEVVEEETEEITDKIKVSEEKEESKEIEPTDSYIYGPPEGIVERPPEERKYRVKPFLTPREKYIPLDKLTELILGKINKVKKSLKKKSYPKKEEDLRNLEAKYRNIYPNFVGRFERRIALPIR